MPIPLNHIREIKPSAATGNRAPRGPRRQSITVRDRRFGRGEDVARWWLGGDPVATAWHNALSATFPRGEAFFVESVRAHRDGVLPALAEEIRAFIQQEVNHSREHLAFNKLVAAQGYDLRRIDARVTELLDLAKDRPAIVNLAATMALEHFTAIMAHLLLSDPTLLEDADPDLAALWRWHAVEEIEHKSVAYDTYINATRDWSSWRRWKLQAVMMLVITKHFVAHRIRDMLDLLAQDGIGGNGAKWRIAVYLLGKPGVLRRLIPAWMGYFLPGFHPWNHDDRALIAGQ